MWNGLANLPLLQHLKSITRQFPTPILLTLLYAKLRSLSNSTVQTSFRFVCKKKLFGIVVKCNEIIVLQLVYVVV